jgi:hypothetical protein
MQLKGGALIEVSGDIGLSAHGTSLGALEISFSIKA